MQEPEIPVTVLTGFLGSGKTTLLKRILSEDHGLRIAVIENEFGEESIDNELLIEDQETRIVEMNNGCICCTVRGDLIDILKDLHRKRSKGELSFDRVVIETTGLADPGPVAQTFFMDDDVASHYLLDAVVTLVDAKHAQRQLTEHPEAQAQVGFADKILLSKTDLVSTDDVADLKHRLLHMNARAKIDSAHFGQVPIKEVLDLRGFNLNAVLELDPQFLSDCEHAHDPDHVHGPECGHGHHHDHEHQHGPDCEHDCGHDHGHEHDHNTAHQGGHSHNHRHKHSDDVQTFLFKSRQAFDPAKLEEFLGTIVQVYGPDLLRYKGVLHMRGYERRIVFQGVHMLMGTDLGRAWNAGEERESKLVFIGKKLPKDLILKGLEQCLAG